MRAAATGHRNTASPFIKEDVFFAGIELCLTKSPNMRFSASRLPTLALYLLPAVAAHGGWGVVSAAAAVALVCLAQFALTFASVAK